MPSSGGSSGSHLSVTLTLLPSPVGDTATTLPWGLLRPPPALCRLHLYLRQVSLVLTLAGRLGAPVAYQSPEGRDKLASALRQALLSLGVSQSQGYAPETDC